MSTTHFRTDGDTLSNGLEDGFICEIMSKRWVKNSSAEQEFLNVGYKMA